MYKSGKDFLRLLVIKKLPSYWTGSSFDMKCLCYFA